MSGILKPLLHPTGTIDGLGDAIHVDNIMAMTKVTALRPAGTSIAQDSIEIVFTFRGDNNVQQTTWRYATEGGRDTSYSSVLTLISNAIA